MKQHAAFVLVPPRCTVCGGFLEQPVGANFWVHTADVVDHEPRAPDAIFYAGIYVA